MIDNWRKSTYSADNSACVETGRAGQTVGYRDSKQASLPALERPMLVFNRDAASAFLKLIKSTG